ncbi:DUF7473 family protein [Halocatena halophila]|uniref:DUF7473 family protein n=1 Tax=Halocatena halophila TaxID=2814576 RepID=UPI002ED41CFF
MTIVIQTAPPGGSFIAYLVTFLLGWGYYAITLHLGVLYVLGETPHQRAAAVGIVPAVISMLFSVVRSPLIILAVLLGDAVAIHMVYRLERRGTAVLLVAHFTIATILGVALFNLSSLAGL